MNQKWWLSLLLFVFSDLLSAQEATFKTQSLTPEIALVAARAALESCRVKGYQVSVAIVDHAGLVQVLLRDRFASQLSMDVAINKAWTASSMHMSTASFNVESQPGKAMNGLRNQPRLIASAGGLVIEAGGSFLGGIGVSGGPGGEADEACAKAGIARIAEALEMQ